MTSHLILGVGHPHRGDDAAGLEVIRRLRHRDLGSTRVLALSGEATEVLDAWQGFNAVTIVDATSGAGKPGALVRLDGRAARFRPGGLRASSHGFGVAEAIGLGRQLGRLPPRLEIYVIEGRQFAVGTGMSPEVERAVATLADLLEETSKPRGSCLPGSAHA